MLRFIKIAILVSNFCFSITGIAQSNELPVKCPITLSENTYSFSSYSENFAQSASLFEQREDVYITNISQQSLANGSIVYFFHLTNWSEDTIVKFIADRLSLLNDVEIRETIELIECAGGSIVQYLEGLALKVTISNIHESNKSSN